MTRFWLKNLSHYPVTDVEEGICAFLARATRDEARGVVLGDIIASIKACQSERNRRELAEIAARQEREYRANVEANPTTQEELDRLRDQIHQLATKPAPWGKTVPDAPPRPYIPTVKELEELLLRRGWKPPENGEVA